MSPITYDLIVIGAGPSGLTAALYGHRSGLTVLILGGETPGGQVTLHHKVENYPGFPGGVSGAELMVRWLKQVADETGSMPILQEVTRVDFSRQVKRVFVGSESHGARTVVVATGSRPRRLGVTGEREFQGKGVYYCATCDAPLLRNMKSRRAVVVGGGDTAAHTALALLPHADTVTVVTRKSEFGAKPVLADRLLTESKAKVLCRHSVSAIVGEQSVAGLALENMETGRTEELPVEAVFVGVGQIPVTDFLNGALELNEEGCIVTDNLLKTSQEGVFAAGDVRATPLRQILTAAADGALAAHGAAQYLRLIRS